ncbi:three-helix bundle dimerization domain-containing protein [Nocardia arizonensis]|uniref:three-helix bundle dimerization domain-containing protein n=1 Tax=Nocardia arizonensis TaxID=1141647 RepID=UPI0006CF4CE1|nr:hypothetical protein [Nocardia arizonensis]
MRFDEETQIRQVIERLANRYPDVGPGTIERTVADARAKFADAKVRDFVPLLVNKRAKQTLARQAH